MREGQPSLKGFCDLGLKLERYWVTHSSLRQRRQVPLSPDHLTTNLTLNNVLLTGTLTNPATAFLIPFLSKVMTLCTILHVYTQIKRQTIVGLTA